MESIDLHNEGAEVIKLRIMKSLNRSTLISCFIR